jgi:prevent-host-death family protein
MRIDVTDATAQLIELIRRAESGEEVVLTVDGKPAVRLAPILAIPDGAACQRILDAARLSGVAHAAPGVSAERSQDFLYDEHGLPC